MSNGKFRLRTADQLLELMETIGPLLPTVRFPFVVVQSAHDEAVLHEGTALLFEQAATPVSCHDIAAIWVAFFSRCQRYRC